MMTVAAGPSPTVREGSSVSVRVDSYVFHLGALGSLVCLGAIMAVTSLKIPLVCPLRLFTGVPCPMCGMTTGTTALMRGDVRSAFAANPLSLVFVPGVFALIVDRGRRIIGRLPEMSPGPRALRWMSIGAAVALVASWVFQLLRFQVIG